MVVAIVLLTVIVFIVVDLTVRFALRRADQARLRKQRQEALDIGLRLEISEEAVSLKRVTVDKPKATILAVDDESIILDGFRKILVLDGFSVDTVETGREALGLVQKNDYDFVFTDLKMPEFDGLEVTKAVKHLRPEVDVVIITGYASVETAVDSMKFGAMDYIQKPFTEDELVGFANNLLIRRQARLQRQSPPRVHVITPRSPQLASDRVYNVPAGVFVSPAHVWIRIEMNGECRAGMDDFARKTIGEIDDVFPPELGAHVKAGAPLFSIRQKTRTMTFPSPVSGVVTRQNTAVIDPGESLEADPYEIGWICALEPENLPADLKPLKIGATAAEWYAEEIERLEGVFGEPPKSPADEKETAGAGSTLSDEAWSAFSSSFLRA